MVELNKLIKATQINRACIPQRTNWVFPPVERLTKIRVLLFSHILLGSLWFSLIENVEHYACFCPRPPFLFIYLFQLLTVRNQGWWRWRALTLSGALFGPEAQAGDVLISSMFLLLFFLLVLLLLLLLQTALLLCKFLLLLHDLQLLLKLGEHKRLTSAWKTCAEC